MEQDRDVQDMMNFLSDIDDDVPQTTSKTASHRAPAAPTPEGVNDEIARRIQEDMTKEEIQKNAASAVMSGKIIYAIQKEGNERDLPPLISSIVKVAVAQALKEAGIVKGAVGTSDTIPSGTSTGTQRPDTKHFREAAKDEDQNGVQGFRSRTEPFFHNDSIEGASVSGGGDPDRQAGEMPAGFDPKAGKFASLARKCASTRTQIAQRRANLELKKASVSLRDAANELAYLDDVEKKVAGIEEDMAMYQQLKQAQESGQPLSPEQQQMLAQLEQKLAVYLQQAQGGAQGGGGPQPQDAAPDAGGQGGPPQPKSASVGNPALAILKELGLYQDAGAAN